MRRLIGEASFDYLLSRIYFLLGAQRHEIEDFMLLLIKFLVFFHMIVNNLYIISKCIKFMHLNVKIALKLDCCIFRDLTNTYYLMVDVNSSFCSGLNFCTN